MRAVWFAFWTISPLFSQACPAVKDEGVYDVAFPIQGGGTAWGDNRVSRALMTVGEAQRLTMGMLRRDADWVRRHFLAALFDNTTWTFTDEEKDYWGKVKYAVDLFEGTIVLEDEEKKRKQAEEQSKRKKKRWRNYSRSY